MTSKKKVAKVAVTLDNVEPGMWVEHVADFGQVYFVLGVLGQTLVLGHHEDDECFVCHECEPGAFVFHAA